MHLASSTGFHPLAIAVAAGVPTSVARSLAGSGTKPRRIRIMDARALLSVDAESLRQRGHTLVDATLAQRALRDLGSWQPDAEYLAQRLRLNPRTAAGLTAGRLDVCPMYIAWHCIALAQDITHQRTTIVRGSAEQFGTVAVRAA